MSGRIAQATTPARFLHGLLLACVCLSLLAGCSGTYNGSSQAVDRRQLASGTRYIVQRGDTLYSIAFRFGLDWRRLAAHNGISAPYLIRPGQVLGLGQSSGQTAAATSTIATRSAVPSAPVRPTTISAPAAGQPTREMVTRITIKSAPPVVGTTAPASTPVQTVMVTPTSNTPATTFSVSEHSASGWAWPAKGPLIGRFSASGSLNKGIDIAGDLGQPVMAAQGGTVVYAGSGLRGYGELLIIKHNDVYVSAYGHNRRLLVKEGQTVKTGQVIAEMGSTGTDRVKLHFEIRKKGSPVDPLLYLPKP